jgi:hypothetical protein
MKTEKIMGPRSRADSSLSNLVLEGGKSRTYKIGRDNRSGRFIQVKESHRKASESTTLEPTNKPGVKR